MLYHFLFCLDTPSKRFRILHILSWIGNISCMILILLAQKHYTIDVFIGYLVGSSVFIQYHQNVDHPSLRESAKTNWRSWIPFQQLAEYKNEGPVPNEFDGFFPTLKILFDTVFKYRYSIEYSTLNNNNNMIKSYI